MTLVMLTAVILACVPPPAAIAPGRGRRSPVTLSVQSSKAVTTDEGVGGRAHRRDRVRDARGASSPPPAPPWVHARSFRCVRRHCADLDPSSGRWVRSPHAAPCPRKSGRPRDLHTRSWRASRETHHICRNYTHTAALVSPTPKN